MARKNALPAPGDQTIVVGDSSTLRGGKQKKRGSAPTGCSVASTLPINDVPGSNGGLYVIDAPNNQAGSAKDHEGTPNTVPLDDDAWVMTLDLAGGARVSIKQDPQNSHRFWIDAGTSNATKTCLLYTSDAADE